MTDLQVYTLVGLVVLIIAIISLQIKKRKNINMLKQEYDSRWGKIPNEKYKNEDLKVISTYYENQIDENKKDFHIDDITWNDLEMDNVFKRINNTVSTPGEEYLYSMLRNPIFDAETLEERDQLMKYFCSEPEVRKTIQLILSSPGKRRYSSVSNILFNNRKIKTRRLFYVFLALAFNVALIYTLFISAQTGLIFLILSFFINMLVYNKAKGEMAAELESMSHIVNLVGCANKLSRVKSEALDKYTETLRECVSKLRGINMRSFHILYSSQDPITEYFKIILFVELISYDSSAKFIYKNMSTIRKLYETIGFLDTMISSASFRQSLSYYTKPTLCKGLANEPKRLSFVDAYHPLIDEPIPNSLDIREAILITGSNASGKSTFLKTIALNALFAQTINTCLAHDYSSNFFLILTSMALRDNLSGKESYYIAEVKSLKRIFDSLNDSIPLLCIIDEVLRGTNTIERIAASSEVLHKLSSSNCICIAATHDLELTYILKNHCASHHFQENFIENEIIFDYKVYSGSSTTRNAIKLLEVIGYEESLVDAAEARAERFINEGKWQEIK
jgi:Mismatch repair ATPase (MutS family)